MIVASGRYKDVHYAVQDPRKVEPIKNAIDKTAATGLSLDGLKIISTAEHDKVLGPKTLGDYDPAKRTVSYRHDVDWSELSTATRRQHPDWDRSTYGGESHLALHEIGHYAHHKTSPDDFFESQASFDSADARRVKAEMGHEYPASNPAEMIAEMYAAKVGGGKSFSPFLEDAYDLYGGPKTN